MPLHVLPEGQSVFVLQPQLPPATSVKQTKPCALAVQSVFDAQPHQWSPRLLDVQADPHG
jgi:hypothetical protein